MVIFFEYDDAENFEVGQLIREGGASWRIIGVRDNGRGIWLSLTSL